MSKGHSTKGKEKFQKPKVHVAPSQTTKPSVTIEEIVKDEQFVLRPRTRLNFKKGMEESTPQTTFEV